MHMGGNMTHLNGDSLFLHCTPPCHLPFFLMLLVAFLFLEKLLQRLAWYSCQKHPELQLHAGSCCSAGTLREFSPTAAHRGPVPRAQWFGQRPAHL